MRKIGITKDVSKLSTREIEVLELLAQGLDNAEISEKLFISIATTQTHLDNIKQKLGIKSNAKRSSGVRIRMILEGKKRGLVNF